MYIPAHLYREIITRMPVACVDLLVRNPKGDVLLLQRNHTPARHMWWFPGGRILYRETRQAAAARKLAEECSLVPKSIEALGTHELQLERDDGTGTAHSITTVYRVMVNRPQRIRLDAQSRAARWRSVDEWLGTGLHPFIDQCLTLYGRGNDD